MFAALKGLFHQWASGPRADSEPRVNVGALRELTEAVGPDSARDILRTFIASTTRDIERMAALIDSPTDLHVLVHSLKSSAKMFGADRLSGLSAHLEDKLDRGKSVDGAEIAELAVAFRDYRERPQVRELAAE